MGDELAHEIEEITQAATDLSLKILPGAFDEARLPVIDWDTSSPSTWKTYLAMAKTLACPFVVLEEYEFDQEQMQKLGPEESEEDDDEDSGDDEEAEVGTDFEAKWEKIVQEYAPYYGSSFAFALYYFCAGICHRYDREAKWYTKLTEAATTIKEEIEAAEAEMVEEEIPALTEKEIEGMSSELANNELFQKAANQNARRFAFKKKFPKVADEHYRQVSEIIDQAKGIFELEIKPELEKALDNQIADLAKQGLNKEQIAKKLKVPASRVKKAL